MDEAWLSRMVVLIQDGLPLPEDDLQTLAALAAKEPSNLDLQVCLGHGLVNGERAEAALPIFERALIRKPDEVIILQGRARAFAALARYAEAEADLRRCLRIQPRHADSLRALALLRLRAGAPSECVKLLELVLETDRFDVEARQILEEAKALIASGATEVQHSHQPASREEFAEALTAALEARGLKSVADADRGILVVRFSKGRDGRLSLGSLFDAYASGTRGLEETVTTLADGLLLMKDPRRIPELDSVREQIFPVVRTPEFLVQSGPTLCAEGPAGLLVCFAIDYPDFVSYLPAEATEKWSVTPADMEKLAMANLARRLSAPARYRVVDGGLKESADQRWDLLAFEAGDGYDAARLLSPEHRALLESLAGGMLVAAIPTRAYALVARGSDAATLRFLGELARAESQTGQRVTERLFRISPGEPLGEWTPPPVARA